MSLLPLRWGILGTGAIARQFVQAVLDSTGGRLVAVGSRTGEAAATFAAAFGHPRVHGSYEALLADPEVEAVYLATPHPWHAQWAIRATEAGKHILCEKPLTLNLEDARCVVAAARAAGVTLMEAYMYRAHPQTAKLVELVRNGAVGRLGLVQASFGFHCPFMPGHRLFANALGGGGILDVGGYPVSMARLLAGAASGRAFADPVVVTGAARLHPVEGTDLHAAATLRFDDGLLAQVACGVSLEMENVVRLFGEEGSIFVPEPWMPARAGGVSRLVLQRRGAAPETIEVPAERPLYVYEVEAFAAAVRAGLAEVPAMTPADTLGNMAALDAWREAAGVVYRGAQA
ncbi:MAG: Gfo/Idh/MocA family oxidoreductase [Opitutaceae bacterium]|nr:Gfo/Idh/MocA family oxidoreductase [Opitutaceae bacterium]